MDVVPPKMEPAQLTPDAAEQLRAQGKTMLNLDAYDPANVATFIDLKAALDVYVPLCRKLREESDRYGRKRFEDDQKLREYLLKHHTGFFNFSRKQPSFAQAICMSDENVQRSLVEYVELRRRHEEGDLSAAELQQAVVKMATRLAQCVDIEDEEDDTAAAAKQEMAAPQPVTAVGRLNADVYDRVTKEYDGDLNRFANDRLKTYQARLQQARAVLSQVDQEAWTPPDPIVPAQPPAPPVAAAQKSNRSAEVVVGKGSHKAARMVGNSRRPAARK